MFNVKRPDVEAVVVGVHHSMSRAMNILSAFRSLALFSLSVDSTEQRSLRGHLELFSREHVWGPRATIPALLVVVFSKADHNVFEVWKIGCFSWI